MYRNGVPYGTGRPDMLTPHEVRTREFTPRRRGVDPDEVRTFQRELAAELTALHQELITVNVENERLKRALRDWQAMYAAQADTAPDAHYPNSGRW